MSGILIERPFMTRIATVLISGLLWAGMAWSADQALEPNEAGISAPSRPTYSLDAKPKINRLDFDFRSGETTAWLNGGGDFHVHGWIPHRGLLCATYRVGMRFGAGSPGCQNVNWITDPVYVTSQYQCNGARVEHDGGDTLPELADRIGQITCAERVVRCSGACR
ncbi:MAG: hypothetical protein ABI771_11365 [Betaproteobacteria bacterium]